MTGKKLLVVILLIICSCLIAAAQSSAQGQSGTSIKHVPIKTTSAASGVQMYKTYCAVCHGLDGKGGGPAASALKVPPVDLSMLSKNNGGKYPSLKVLSAINGETALPAHGSKEMPVWGKLFQSMSGGHEGNVQLRASNLTKYIETLQAK